MFLVISDTPIEGARHHAFWRADPPCDVDHPAGAAEMGQGPADIYFAIAETPAEPRDGLSCEDITLPPSGWALRIDEVAFPVGAVAYRHTHAGRGWRFLVSGALRIETDHGQQTMAAGMSWFEPENSPVRAVALQASGVTRFVRCMVIPSAFLGHSTFQLCDPADAQLPRLQVTHRHFDFVP